MNVRATSSMLAKTPTLPAPAPRVGSVVSSSVRPNSLPPAPRGLICALILEGFKNMHKAKRNKIVGRGTVGKTAVFGMVERHGPVVTAIVGEESQSAVLPNVREKVLPSALIYSDEHAAYNPLQSMGYQHRRVHHAAKVYVQGDAHTNTIEGFWSLVKRGISGVNHAGQREITFRAT